MLPAMNAVSECSASALRRLKTYLQTTMSQKRLNHCMILHGHNEMTDKLDILKISFLLPPITEKIALDNKLAIPLPRTITKIALATVVQSPFDDC